MDNEIIQNYILAAISLLTIIFTYFHDKVDEKDVEQDNRREKRDSVIASSEKVVNTALSLLEPLERQIKVALEELEECREYKVMYDELKKAHDKLVTVYEELGEAHKSLQTLYANVVSK